MDIILLLAIVVISNVLFWGLVIYLIVKFWRSSIGLSTEEKSGIIAAFFSTFSHRGSSAQPGPNESVARGMLSSEGIDPDR